MSTLLDGEFGLRDVCLSVPCIVSARGVERIVENPLSKDEVDSLRASAALLKKAIGQLGSGT